jgi:hypothetical protein
MFIILIFHLTHAGKYYFVLYQFNLYNTSDHRYEKPVAYKFIYLVSEPKLDFFKNLIMNMKCNFSMTEELPALLSRDQKILSTCNKLKIFTGDQMAFIS